MAAAEYNLGLVYLFSAEVPGLTKLQATEQAIAHLSRYHEMRPRAPKGAGDDVEELLQRARNKKAIIEALAAEQTAPPPPPPEPSQPPQDGSAEPQPPASGPPPSTGSFDPVE
jgi:hypothetical protein